jgi:hypothetical protein
VGEIIQVAEAQEDVVVVPGVLEVAEVEVEVAIRVGVHVRHPVVAVGIPYQQCTMHLLFHQEEHRFPFAFYSESLILAGTSHRLI